MISTTHTVALVDLYDKATFSISKIEYVKENHLNSFSKFYYQGNPNHLVHHPDHRHDESDIESEGAPLHLWCACCC